MHLIFGATGIIHELDMLEAYLSTFPVALPYKNDDGAAGVQYINAQLRPIRFYDYVFPKEELGKMINTLKPETEIKSQNAMLPNAYFYAIRKALKLIKVPPPMPHLGRFPMPKFNVRVVGLGIRGDSDITFPKVKQIRSTHEGL